MVAGVHDAQHSEDVSTLRMIGRPMRSSGSPRAQDSQSGVAIAEVGHGIARRHGGRAARGNVTITTITRSGSSCLDDGLASTAEGNQS